MECGKRQRRERDGIMSIGRVLPFAIVLVFALALPGCKKDDDDEDEGARSPAATPAPPEQSAPLQQAGKTLTYNFDNLQTGPLPPAFTTARTGGGAVGLWEIQADDTAPSKPNVLAQKSIDQTDYRFPVAVSNEGAFRDFDLSVKFMPVSGKI